MCGITGIFNFNPRDKIDPLLLRDMNQALFHRGPDDEGTYIQGSVGLAMRRLSIIDIAGGKQPIANEEKNIWAVFNGEIYNYKELSRSLIQKGHILSGNSDAETIVHLYEEYGIDFIDHLRGMFSIALWDEKKRKLILARDRFGIKPLFYAHLDNQLLFGSEMKAILKHVKISREIDDTALAAYFNLCYIPAPLTIFKKIRKLLPGHILIVQDGAVKVKKYWDLEFRPDRSKKEKFFIDGFMSLLQESVDIRLMSEVPLGAFLSGGVDSSLIVALMSNVCDEPVNTISIGFGGNVGGYLDERRYAQIVASRYNTNHREHEVLPNIEGILETIVRAFDEPFADDSTIPSYFVCKAAKENVTVALSGLGGDEVFSGYARHLGFALSKIYEKVPLFMREQWIRKLIEKLPERTDGHYTINHMKRFVRSASQPADRRYFGYRSLLTNSSRELFADPDRFRVPLQECQDIILSYFNASNATDDINRVFYCDIKTYLPEDILAVTDRLSMHHSLEVRVPFLDHKLVEFCATIPPMMKMKWYKKKYLLKKASASLLPKEVINHRKQGFVGPMTRWLQTDLKGFVLKTLSERNLNKHKLFNSNAVKCLLDEHFDGKEIHDTLIWSLVVFQVWYDLYIERS